MWDVRRAADRGHGRHGWLDTRHTFSFADYHDPRFLGFRGLRVINEDRVAPAAGFGTHPHRDMEIITYVVSGRLAHRDSLGREETLGPDEVQRISAGTGITHSEFNASDTTPVHFYQIWLNPDRRGTQPSYEQASFPSSPGTTTIATPEGRDGSLSIGRDVVVERIETTGPDPVEVRIAPGRHAWLQMISGSLEAIDSAGRSVALAEGDGLAVSDESRLELRPSGEGARLLRFDLA
ncbi:MAG: pirin family protein [Isosphaeraceae bacterium]|nr:pirin family protein [Isosphaeraceae bacterium]